MNIARKKIYSNGATLIYKHRKRKCTSVVAGFAFGSNRENYPEPTAHFCEHMFFIETENRSKETLKQDMLNTFSMKNGRTNAFYTEIDFCRSNKVLEDCFALSSDMLLNTKYEAKYIKSEKGVIKQELVRKLNNPDALSYFTLLRATTSKDIKNSLVLGNEDEIEAVTAKSLKKFRDETFISQNFVISIEGGISFLRAKHLAEKYFIKKLKSNPSYPVDQSILFKQTREGNLNIENYPFKKSICRIAIKINQESESQLTEKSALMFCSICNGINGRLLSALRENGLVYSAGLGYDTVPTQNVLHFDFSCSTENVNKVIDETGKCFEEFRTTLVEEELIKQKKKNEKLLKDEMMSKIYPSNLFTNYLAFGDRIFSKKHRKTDKKIFDSLTPNDVQNFCKMALSKPENIYVAILTDGSEKDFYTYEEMQKILTSKPQKKRQAKKVTKTPTDMQNTQNQTETGKTKTSEKQKKTSKAKQAK